MKKDFSIDVLGKIFNITHVEGLKEEENAWGLFEEEKCSIKIDSRLRGELYVATLIHEIGHAIFSRGGARQGIDSQAEEMLVDQIGIVLSENFRITPL